VDGVCQTCHGVVLRVRPPGNRACARRPDSTRPHSFSDPAPVAVDLSGVDECHTAVEGSINHAVRLFQTETPAEAVAPRPITDTVRPHSPTGDHACHTPDREKSGERPTRQRATPHCCAAMRMLPRHTPKINAHERLGGRTRRR